MLVEPKSSTEMQSWLNIYGRIPTKYLQYVSVPVTNECPSRSEINSKLTHACTTDSNELADYNSITLNFSDREELTSDSLAENWMYDSTTQRDIQLRYGTTYLLNQFAIGENIEDYTGSYTTKVTGQTDLFEVLRLDRGVLRVMPLNSNLTNMTRAATIAVTAMGKTTYIYIYHKTLALDNVKVSEIDNDAKTFGMNLAADLVGNMLDDQSVSNRKN